MNLDLTTSEFWTNVGLAGTFLGSVAAGALIWALRPYGVSVFARVFYHLAMGVALGRRTILALQGYGTARDWPAAAIWVTTAAATWILVAAIVSATDAQRAKHRATLGE